jgi:hypothetical protein
MSDDLIIAPGLTEKGSSQDRCTVCETSGKILPGGHIIDLLAIPNRDSLELLLWSGANFDIGQQAVVGDVTYRPAQLRPEIRGAMRFPSAPEEYGSTLALFKRIAGILEQHAGMEKDQITLASSWALSTWIPELMAIPPTLCVSGATMYQAVNLFRILKSFCRRSLQVAELNRNLPMFLRPTLFVLNPVMSKHDSAFWRSANIPGNFVAGDRGALSEIVSSKAFLLPPHADPATWGEETVHLSLTPDQCEPPSNRRRLAGLATEIQSQCLLYRLRRLSEKEEPASEATIGFESGLARDLAVAVHEETGILELLRTALQSHVQEMIERRSIDPRVAILESIWAPSHESGKLRTSEITDRTNVILRSRGESLEFNARQIGWHLRKMGIGTRRVDGTSRGLVFCSAVRGRVHELTVSFGLRLRTQPKCPLCEPSSAADNKAVQ